MNYQETEIEFVDGYEELEEDDEDMEDFYGFPSNEPGFDNDNEHGKNSLFLLQFSKLITAPFH